MKKSIGLLSLLLLAGCGGGGGGGVASTAANAGMLSGTAAVGAPVNQGSITVVDATGKVVGSTLTSAAGSYSLTLAAGAVAPLMLELTGGSYTDRTVTPVVVKALPAPLHAVANGAGIANITPLTEMVVAHALSASPAATFATCSNTPALCTISATMTPAKVQLAHDHLLAALQTVVNQVVAAVGSGSITNFLTQSFVANSVTPMDVLLDTLKPAVKVVAGEPQMTLSSNGLNYVFALTPAGAAAAAMGAPVASSVVSAGLVNLPSVPAAVAKNNQVVMANQAGAAISPIAAEFVTAHNNARALVGVPGVTYSTVLEASAQAWVNQLKATNNCGLLHSTGGYGENLYAIWGGTATPTQVVASWTAEKPAYNYATNTCAVGSTCGHYTQIVWRNTTQIGCALATCPAISQQVWACQYNPPGNYVGQKPY